MKVIKVVDQDIADKIDTRYINDQFAELQKVCIAFICTSEGGEEDEWIDDDSGMRYIVIHLPYKIVKHMPDARPLMLQLATLGVGDRKFVELNCYLGQPSTFHTADSRSA